MQFESRITWEKLSLELDLLSAEDPNTLAPLLAGINSLLWPDEPQDWTFRTLSYMGYELSAKCDGLCENDRLHVLNDYFFAHKDFQVTGFQLDDAKENEVLIKPVLQNKLGSAPTIAIIYLHLATHLHLPIYLIHTPGMNILKWVRAGQSQFLDISHEAKLISEEQLVSILNKCYRQHESNSRSDVNSFEILPSKFVMGRYLEILNYIYSQQNKAHLLRATLDVQLKVEPSNLLYLAQRALLLKDMGFRKEAMADLKRYFSFSDRNSAPGDLQLAYYELKTLTTVQYPDLLH